MPTFVLRDTHTLASALREALESGAAHDGSFVACTVAHPLDAHLEVEAPTPQALREALLAVKERIRHTRAHLK
jgi:DNA-directed RNA polymerase subunit L